MSEYDLHNLIRVALVLGVLACAIIAVMMADYDRAAKQRHELDRERLTWVAARLREQYREGVREARREKSRAKAHRYGRTQ